MRRAVTWRAPQAPDLRATLASSRVAVAPSARVRPHCDAAQAVHRLVDVRAVEDKRVAGLELEAVAVAPKAHEAAVLHRLSEVRRTAAVERAVVPKLKSTTQCPNALWWKSTVSELIGGRRDAHEGAVNIHSRCRWQVGRAGDAMGDSCAARQIPAPPAPPCRRAAPGSCPRPRPRPCLNVRP